MAKVGLKDTLALIAKGYSKKEIDALAAIDEEQEAPEKDEAPSATPAPVEDKKAPEDAAAKESIQEPDYKSMYEELLEKNILSTTFSNIVIIILMNIIHLIHQIV